MALGTRDEPSLTRLAIYNAVWVSKKFFSVGLEILPECIQCHDLEELIKHTFFTA